MGEAIWGAAAEAAVGIGTAVYASSQAGDQEEYMQSLVNQGSGNRDMIEGIDRYFLGGGKASALDIPGFADQFGQLDFMRQEQESLVEQEIRNSQQMIEDTMPSGGAKLRALAELSIKSQDAKNTVTREYEGKKNDLDVQLTNQYMQGAMGRQSGVGLNTQYAMGNQNLQTSQNMMAGIGQGLGNLAGSLAGGNERPQYEYTPPRAPTSASSTLNWDEANNEDYWDFTDGK